MTTQYSVAQWKKTSLVLNGANQVALNMNPGRVALRISNPTGNGEVTLGLGTPITTQGQGIPLAANTRFIQKFGWTCCQTIYAWGTNAQTITIEEGVQGTTFAPTTLPEVTAWQSAVVAAGGTVSAARLARINLVVASMKDTNVYPLIDDMGFPAAENVQQGLVSLKQRRLGVFSGAVTFVADRGFKIDVAGTYTDLGFIPSVHCIVGSASNISCGVRETFEFTSNSSAMGTQSSSGNLVIRPRVNVSSGTGLACSSAFTFNLNPQTSLSMTLAQQKNGVFLAYQDGVQCAPLSTPTLNTLPNISLWLGGANNSGVLANGRTTGQQGFWYVGAAFTDETALALSRIVNTHLIALGNT